MSGRQFISAGLIGTQAGNVRLAGFSDDWVPALVPKKFGQSDISTFLKVILI